MPASAKDDCEALLNALMHSVEQMLLKHGMIYPFGAAMRPNDEVTLIATLEDDERPPAQAVIDSLLDGLRESAAKGHYKAAAIVFASRVRHAGERTDRSAITVELEHVDRFAALMHYPYSIGADAVTFGEPSVATCSNRIFV
jgi:hypothetical protein